MRKSFLNKLHDRRGFSMVELMVVVAILAVVMMAVVSLYIPVQRSTAVQTQVSDVQSNLRLALNTMTRDLLLAGFLVPENPVVFENSATPTTAQNPDPVDFTIRTRTIGNGFARVATNSVDMSGNVRLEVADADMLAAFPAGSRVRIYEPITGAEVNVGTGTNATRAYLVESNSGAIVVSGDAPSFAELVTVASSNPQALSESLVVGVRDVNQPSLQTIRYRLNGGALERIVNGSVQYLTRNLDTDPALSRFNYNLTDEGRVNYVEIKLTGKTRAVGNETVATEKIRTVETSVKLRNVY